MLGFRPRPADGRDRTGTDGAGRLGRSGRWEMPQRRQPNSLSCTYGHLRDRSPRRSRSLISGRQYAVRRDTTSHSARVALLFVAQDDVPACQRAIGRQDSLTGIERGYQSGRRARLGVARKLVEQHLIDRVVPVGQLQSQPFRSR